MKIGGPNNCFCQKSSIIALAIVVITISSSLIAYNASFVIAQKDSNQGITVTVTTDRGRYILDENVKIWGIVFDKACNPTVATVTIQVLKDNEVLYTVSKVTAPQNGSYFDNGYNIQETGAHKIIVTAYYSGYNINASTSVNADFYRDAGDLLKVYWPEATIILISLFYFIVVIAISSHENIEAGKEKPRTNQRKGRQLNTKNKEKQHLQERLSGFFGQLFKGRFFVATMFFILTIFTVVIVVTLFFMPSPIGVTSPFGLVINQDVSNETQWVINIGGQPISDTLRYAGGIQIPIYVIVLSFLGAYVYFLIQVPKLVKLRENSKLVNGALPYLVRFFMAPLLAVALYLVLWQLEVRGTFILAAISFATGLIIEQVTERIIEFARGTIGKKSDSTTSQEKAGV